MNPTRIAELGHDGLTFDVFDTGPADGEPVVLLHGFPERSTCWSEVAPLLHDRGYRTIAMDQRGYSPGARPRRRRDYRIPLLVGDVVALLTEVGTPAHLVGHDWGAVPAWLTAAERPDLVRSLTAVSVPHPAAFLRSFVRSSQALQSWYMGFFNLPRVPEWVVTSRPRWFDLQLRKGGMTEDDVARFRREIVDDGALPTALNWYRALPLSDPRRAGGRVRVPTSLVWSTEDVALGRWSAEHAGDFVDAPYELVVLEGVSHWIPTQAPKALAEAIVERAGSVGAGE